MIERPRDKARPRGRARELEHHREHEAEVSAVVRIDRFVHHLSTPHALRHPAYRCRAVAMSHFAKAQACENKEEKFSYSLGRTNLRKAAAAALGRKSDRAMSFALASIQRDSYCLCIRDDAAVALSVRGVPMTTRETILRSWWAARRQADVNGAVTLTAASFAGFALEAADGDTERAKALVPPELEVFWARTRDALEQVALEERRPIPSALAATGTGR